MNDIKFEAWPTEFRTINPYFGANPPNYAQFGFSTGDEGIAEPYFYITAYPLPPDLPATPLPAGVEWHIQGWQGALLRYSRLVGASDAEDRLLTYFRTVQQAGMRLMRG
jgi:hypothetical protein